MGMNIHTPAVVSALSRSPRREVIGDAELWLGDCREVLNGIRDAAAIITDPPYGIGYVTNRRKVSATPAAIQNDAAAPLWCVDLIASACTDGGAVYLCTSLAVQSVWEQAMRAAHLTIKTPIIWDKGIWTAGDLTGDFGNQVEIVLFAHRGRHQLRAGRISNLWPIPRPPAGDHPTPKPVALMARCIECSTDHGDLVVDPFMGEGPTAVAASRLGRKFIGVEIEPIYFVAACRRVEAAQRQADMFSQVPA